MGPRAVAGADCAKGWFLSALQSGYKPQDIVRLSGELSRLEIPHRLSERVLEIKLY
jgi:hypothetical protein